ncbi:MAG: peptidase C1 [Ignavibacteriales bacterium]|nr:peptidase C1 [Ignavibacteriales bacterium]
MKALRGFVATLLLCASPVFGQSIKQSVDDFLKTLSKPTSKADFDAVPHLSPLNQDTTLICWSFATSSFLESEMERLKMPPVRLSVLYPLYCVFQEKAKRFVATKGASRFSPGDLFTGVLDMYSVYGAMPAEAYGNKIEGTTTFNHQALYAELEQLMAHVKSERLWDEAQVMPKVRAILNKYLGEPPSEFRYQGTTYTPQRFLHDVVRLPWQEYVLVTSFQYAPFHQFVELKVPDNWLHQKTYFNVPLDVFYGSIKTALQAGYSVAFDADISEPSYRLTKQYAVIPPFDCPFNAITAEAREFRFENESTTDDHLMQFVGFKKFGTEEWFLVKDSWRTAFEGPGKGYMFFHESYIKLKVLAILVHRDAIPDIAALVRSAKTN